MSAASPAPDGLPDTGPHALPLSAWHARHGARMVPFAGYSMPMQYEGIIAEHLWTREHAGLFDVSHMGQLTVSGAGAGNALEAVLPADLAALKPGRMRYSLLLADDGGILDDLIATNWSDGEESFGLIVNGATKLGDIAHLRERLPDGLELSYHDDRALLALQGPEAGAVLDGLIRGIDAQLSFMQATKVEWHGAELLVARSGYTGEDGFEISMPADAAEDFANALIGDQRVKAVGLGARDALRLEAGLPLYGHDMDEGIDPITAGLTFALSKRRRQEGGFPGAARIGELLENGSDRVRVGLALEGRLPAREGSEVYAGDEKVGVVTSGGFAPSLDHPIAMAFVDKASSASSGSETGLTVDIRGRRLPARIVPMPFVPHRYRRQGGMS